VLKSVLNKTQQLLTSVCYRKVLSAKSYVSKHENGPTNEPTAVFRILKFLMTNTLAYYCARAAETETHFKK
jgi:hypothetical protein